MFKIEKISDDKVNIVNFSGGRTSAFMVYLFERAKKKNPKIKVEYVFCDTGAEHPKTYEFIKNVVNHFNIDLTCIRASVPLERGKGSFPVVVELDECKPDLKPFIEVVKKYGTPTTSAPKCTDNLKYIPADKYINNKYGKGGFYKWLGIRVDEPRRLKHADSQIDLFEKGKRNPNNIKYLAQISEFTKTDILFFWAEMPFDLEIPEYLGNCLFCIKKPEKKVALAAKDEPEMAKQFIKMVNADYVANIKTKEISSECMYRQQMSLEGIIKKYENTPKEDLIDSLRGIEYGQDNSSCGESCEAMSMSYDPEDFELEIQ